MSAPLPDRFRAAVQGAWPVEGPEFLARLPRLIREFEDRWQLRALSPFPLSYNYVCPAVLADGSQAVLKLGVPNPELTAEVSALQQYRGCGAVRLLAADPVRGAMLLERVWPGEPLAHLADDEQATVIAAEVMTKLWQPLPPEHPFPSLRRWTRALRHYMDQYRGRPGPLPWLLIERAAGILDDLLVEPDDSVLIHGDFHHWNVLRAEREPWLAIDPKGLAAERTFDVGPLLYNPVPTVFAMPDLARLTARRLDLLAEHLELDRRRLLSCGIVAAALSACWSVEDAGGASPEFIAFAGVLVEFDR